MWQREGKSNRRGAQWAYGVSGGAVAVVAVVREYSENGGLGYVGDGCADDMGEGG